MEAKPTLRLIHQLGRSGGTVICRCISSMGNVALLSEIHPLGTSYYNPFVQANDWHKVFTEQDIEFINNTKFDFSDAILFIHEKLAAQGKTLVIRDWTHLDYYGIPYVDDPSYRLLLAESLQAHFNFRQFATVRHPVDQFISTKPMKIYAQDDRMNIPAFLSGYLAFARQAKDIGFIRYEDFTQNPDEVLQIMCAQLEIDFDPEYKKKWYSNTCITGDIDHIDDPSPSPSRGSESQKILSLPRKEVPIDLLALFSEHDDYHVALDLLGYQ